MSDRTAKVALGAYRAVDAWGGIEDASPQRLVALMLDGVVQAIAKARSHLLSGDLPAKAAEIGRAIGLIDGLQSALDSDKGGEIASGLDRLYDYTLRQLVLANASNDVALLDEVSSLIGEINEAWRSLPETNEAGTPQTAVGGV